LRHGRVRAIHGQKFTGRRPHFQCQ
jgi:hypothetical protein